MPKCLSEPESDEEEEEELMAWKQEGSGRSGLDLRNLIP